MFVIILILEKGFNYMFWTLFEVKHVGGGDFPCLARRVAAPLTAILASRPWIRGYKGQHAHQSGRGTGKVTRDRALLISPQADQQL